MGTGETRKGELSGKAIMLGAGALTGIGVFGLLLLYAKGNLLILAAPASFWACMTCWSSSDINGRSAPSKLLQWKRSGRSAVRTRSPILRVGIAVVLAVGALVGWGYQLAKAPDETADGQVAAAMARATRVFEQGKLVEALREFQAIRVPPSLPKRAAQKNHNVGVVLFMLDRFDEARRNFLEALKRDPLDVDACVFLARIAQKWARDEEALVWGRRASELSPDRHDVVKLLGELEKGAADGNR